jgi:hypothetical protein
MSHDKLTEVLHPDLFDLDPVADALGGFEPLKGVRSRTAMYERLYAVIRPVVPVLRSVCPNAITTTVEVGRALIRVVREQPDDVVLEQRRIVELGRS